MKDEELLAALTAKVEEARELLSDMRSMEKTLRRTGKDVGSLIAATIDKELMAIIESRTDDLIECLKEDLLAAGGDLRKSLEVEANKMMGRMERKVLQKIADFC